jgi:hypothetical protein
VTLKDGTARTVYRSATTGELRYKRYSTRDGKRVATYVKLVSASSAAKKKKAPAAAPKKKTASKKTAKNTKKKAASKKK